MDFKKKPLLSLIFISSFITLSVFAKDNIAVEDYTPPPPNKALTLEQIQPLNTTEKKIQISPNSSNSTSASQVNATPSAS